MANPSIYIPDDLLEDFDEVLKQKKLREDIPMDTSRSELIQEWMQEYVEGNVSCSPATTVTPATSD